RIQEHAWTQSAHTARKLRIDHNEILGEQSTVAEKSAALAGDCRRGGSGSLPVVRHCPWQGSLASACFAASPPNPSLRRSIRHQSSPPHGWSDIVPGIVVPLHVRIRRLLAG